MFRTKRRLWFLLAALIVAAAAILFIALSQGPPTAIATDGRSVTIEKVTFGTHHRFTQGKWWVRVLKPIMGRRWAAQRGCYETRFTNNWPAMMVWTRWEGATASNGIAVEATLLDDAGTESALVLNQWNAVPPPSAGGAVENAHVAWLFRNFPRRSETIRFRVYDRGPRYVATQAVEIAFSNPARKRFPSWNGSELPLVIKTNNTEFVLTSVRQISNALWRLDFLVRTNGVLDPSWLVGGITALSASGNRLSTRSNLAATATTNLTFHLRGALWPEEPVWRFATEFVRIADFQPEEMWSITNLIIPARGTRLQFTTNLPALSDVPLEFEFKIIPRTVPYWSRGLRRNASLSIHFEAHGRHLLLVEAKDQQDRTIAFEVDPGAPRMVYAFGLAIPEGAKSANFSIAVPQPTVITFNVPKASLTELPVSTK